MLSLQTPRLHAFRSRHHRHTHDLPLLLGFHHGTGSGYALLADWLIRLDPLNPQTAARMSVAFESWPRYDADRQAMMRAALQRIMATPGLSRDLSEMAGRMLG